MSTDTPTVDFYWRPGCPFCSQLERGLNAKNIKLRKHNIWDSPNNAAHVRAATGGNETVPTVTIAGVSLVNPSVGAVTSLLAQQHHQSN